MNIFQKISLINKISKAIKKSKKLIDEKKDLAEKVREQINKLCGDFQELIRLLPDFKNIYLDILTIIEETK